MITLQSNNKLTPIKNVDFGIIQYNLNRDLIPKNVFNFTNNRPNDKIQKIHSKLIDIRKRIYKLKNIYYTKTQIFVIFLQIFNF